MKKFYAALLLLSVNYLSYAQQTDKKLYLTNNMGDAEKAYKTSVPGGSFFSFPVNDRSAYNEMLKREASRNHFKNNEEDNLAAGLDYDVKYYRLDLRINPDSVSVPKYVIGNITTHFTTLQSNFNLVRFDFASALICDSVYYHGTKLSAGSKVEIGDTLEITIPTIAVAGTLDSITVYYRGVPPVITDFSGSTGFVNNTHNGGLKYIYTLSEPYGASTWWPCKSRVASDKADSVDMIISTPSGFKVAANGTRVSENIVGTDRISIYKHRYPISSYQVCLGIANYIQYPLTPTMVNIGGTMMPYYNLLFPETSTTNSRIALDRTPLMLTTFSAKFGDYPFKNEKYGHYTFGFGGGMEHNTFSGMGATTYDATTDWSVIAHELGHQWWGAAVTCGSWKDIWVNESFARYSEVVCLEFAPSVSATTYTTHRTNLKASAISVSNQAKSTYQNDTTSITTIFSPSVYIYDRGALIISMLRTTLGDTKFFQALQNYQADPTLKYSSAYTDDVKRHMEAVSGLDLSQFFNDWIYNTGFANYNAATWNNSGSQIVLRLPQTTQLSGISHFDMPVAVRIRGAVPASEDTTIIVYDKGGILHYVNDGVLTSSGGSLVQFGLSFVPTTITFDSYAQVLANGSFAKDPGLSLLANNEINFTAKKDNGTVKLNWDVESAQEFKSYELEKSADAVSFVSFNTVKSNGNPAKTFYTAQDYKLFTGTSYYRVKLFYNNGSFIYSKTIAISNGDDAITFTITPNPASSFINISTSSIEDKIINIRVLDGSGRLMDVLRNQSLAAGKKIQLTLSKYRAGNYFVEIEGAQITKSVNKIIIVK